jgi:hypothetical protein
MIDQRERYERAFAGFEPPPDALERFLTYQDRRRRRRQATAGVVGIAIFVVTVSIVTMRWSFDRTQPPAQPGPPAPSQPSTSADPDGGSSIGLPPDGVDPSSPGRGQLVISYYGRPSFGVLQVLVYADGRVIWREEYGPKGADGIRTGFLERRLTPEGVELLRSEVIASGLFDRDHDFDAGRNIPGGDEHGLIWGEIRVDDGDRSVSVRWGGGESPTTLGEATALRWLNDLFSDPVSRLPVSAWDDPKATAYIPSRYAICYRQSLLGAYPPLDPSEVLNLLPTAAEDLLAGRDQTYEPSPYEPSQGGRQEVCSGVTTEEARLLDEILNDAGIEPRPPAPSNDGLTYDIQASPPIALAFLPILPHGQWSRFVG